MKEGDTGYCTVANNIAVAVAEDSPGAAVAGIPAAASWACSLASLDWVPHTAVVAAVGACSPVVGAAYSPVAFGAVGALGCCPSSSCLVAAAASSFPAVVAVAAASSCLAAVASSSVVAVAGRPVAAAVAGLCSRAGIWAAGTAGAWRSSSASERSAYPSMVC